MPARSSLQVDVPNINLLSLLLDGIPDDIDLTSDPLLSKPYLLAAEDPSNTLSLIQLKHYAQRFAAGLRQTTFQPGDRVAIVSPNYINSTIVLLGCIIAGGVWCAAQPDLFLRDYIDQFARDEPNILIVADDQPQCQIVLDAWQASGRDVNGRVWLLNNEPVPVTPSSPSLGDVENRGSDPLPVWNRLLDTPPDPSLFDDMKRSITPDRPCMLLTTSGTSGLRKAAVYTHANLVASFVAIGHRSRSDAIALAKAGKGSSPAQNPTLRILHTISISRAMGATLPLATLLRARAMPTEIFFMCKTYIDMAPYLHHIQTLGITELAVAPFTLVRLFKGKGDPGAALEHDRFPSLIRVNVVGAPSSQSNLDRVRDFLLAHGAPPSLRVERSYGITEAATLVATCRPIDEDLRQEGYQGRLDPNIEAKVMTIVDDDDHGPSNEAVELPDGHVGEIWFRGPSFISGYFQHAAATHAAFAPGGWFRSGDVGYLDADRVFLVDRKKDILKTPDNVPPAYIEALLLEHPDVLDAGVIGVYQPHDELQLVRAYVVPRQADCVAAQDLVDWIATRSAPTAHLTAGVEFVDELPRNAGGKILRRVLRERAAQRFGRLDAPSMVVPQARK